MSWSHSSTSPPPRHRPSPSSEERFDGRRIRSSAELEAAVDDPNSVVVYVGSGRKLSAQQLQAAHRRFSEAERRQQAELEVRAAEERLTDTLNCWRDMPRIPSAEGYRSALDLQPFSFDEVPPEPPNANVEIERLRESLDGIVRSENPPPFSATGLPWLAALVLAATMAGVAHGVGQLGLLALGLPLAAAVGYVISALATRRYDARIAAAVSAKLAASWPVRAKALADAYQANLERFVQRRAAALDAWQTAEEARIAFIRRLFHGDLDAIEEAVNDSLSDLDFPFETEAEVAAADSETLYVHLDLPEIEDLIPAVRHQVLKDGRVKEVARKKAEQHEPYAGLVTGLALMVASASFAAAPTMAIVHVAAYTQRKQRGSQAIDDDYVYFVAIPREEIEQLVPQTVDPVAMLSRLQGRLEQTSSFELKKLKPPPWAAEFVRVNEPVNQ
jgi:hypothetical protein